MDTPVDDKRTAGKVEECLNLAHQHLANHAYAQAREALKNALQLSPKDDRAAQLLNEIDWQEQEYRRIQVEKQQLYEAAVEAWSRRDVSAALGKLQLVRELDQRAPDSSASEWAASFQSLYNQVRSEHDAMHSAYAEARKLLSEGKFSAALSICDACLAKYPSHALFQNVKSDIEARQQQELSAPPADPGRHVEPEPLAAGSFQESLETLRAAHGRDEANSAARQALLDGLTQRAQTLLETDWRAAEPLLQEALALDPNHALANSLYTVAQDRKRQSLIQVYIAQAQHAQASGDVGGALKQVQQGLSAYASDASLSKLHSTLSKEYEATQRLQALPFELDKELVAPEVPVAGSTAPEVPPLASFLKPAATASTPASPLQSVSPQDFSATRLVAQVPVQPAPPLPMPAADTMPPAPPQEVSTSASARKQNIWLLVGAFVLVVIGLAALLLPRAFWRKPVAPTVTSVSSENRAPVLAPALATLRVFTDLENAKVVLDGNEVNALEAGQFNSDNLSDGQHSLEVTGGASHAKISVVSARDSMPTIGVPIEAKNLKAIVVANGPRQGQLVSSYGPIQATLDGQAIGAASSAPLLLSTLSPGTHDLVLGTGDSQRKVSFQAGAEPAITVFLSADRDVGSLLIVTGEDGATVLLNGRKYPRTTRHGQLVLANLPPKPYKVAVVKEGFLPAPEQQANVQKGQEAKLEFALRPVPTVASLMITGAMAMSEVLLDGKSLGTIQPDGSLSVSNIKPGPHTIKFRKDAYKPKEFQKQFVAGQVLFLGGTEVAMESAAPAAPPAPALAPPKLIVQTVAGAQVIMDGRAVGQVGSNGHLEITGPAGEHIVEFVMKPYQTFKTKVTLSAGHALTITPNLQASLPVTHKHTVGSCTGNLIVGQSRIQYQGSGNDSFDYPLSWVDKSGAAESGKGLYLEFGGVKRRLGLGGGKRYVFVTPAAAEILQIIQNNSPKQ